MFLHISSEQSLPIINVHLPSELELSKAGRPTGLSTVHWMTVRDSETQVWLVSWIQIPPKKKRNCFCSAPDHICIWQQLQLQRKDNGLKVHLQGLSTGLNKRNLTNSSCDCCLISVALFSVQCGDDLLHMSPVTGSTWHKRHLLPQDGSPCLPLHWSFLWMVVGWRSHNDAHSLIRVPLVRDWSPEAGAEETVRSR